MSWNEPRRIAERLAARLELPLWERPEDASAPGGVLLVDSEALRETSSSQLEHVLALVAVGRPEAATDRGLAALRAAVAASGAAPALAAFATAPGAGETASEVPLVVGARPDDKLVPALLAAGPHALTLDSSLDLGAVSSDSPPARVCVVSFEVSGMTGGGIGTASTSLAEALARAGHDVTLLFTGWQEPDAGEQNERWRAHYAERGVRLAFVRRPGTSTVKSPHFPVRSAYEVYAWLRREPSFDVVHLPENMGHGAYAQLAKLQGLQFASTTFVIGTHGPTRWAAEANRVALTREEFLVNDALERLSVAHADVLLGPSRYLHDYLRARGWQLPDRVHVQAYATPSAVRATDRDPRARDAARERPPLPTRSSSLGDWRRARASRRCATRSTCSRLTTIRRPSRSRSSARTRMCSAIPRTSTSPGARSAGRGDGRSSATATRRAPPRICGARACSR